MSDSIEVWQAHAARVGRDGNQSGVRQRPSKVASTMSALLLVSVLAATNAGCGGGGGSAGGPDGQPEEPQTAPASTITVDAAKVPGVYASSLGAEWTFRPDHTGTARYRFRWSVEGDTIVLAFDTGATGRLAVLDGTTASATEYTTIVAHFTEYLGTSLHADYGTHRWTRR